MECPRCKSKSYSNPTLKLMVNDCGHSLCNSCVQLLFSRGQAPCPQCHINLKKSAFREQMFDDPMVDKEVNIRTKISKIYNKRYPEDFRSESEYDDYLEKIEELVWATMDGEEWARQDIMEYERTNQMLIRTNTAKSAKEMEILNQRIVDESARVEEVRKRLAVVDSEIERKRKEKESELIQKIETNGDISEVLLAKTNIQNTVESELMKEEVIMHHQEAQEIENYIYTEKESNNFGPTVPKEFNDYFSAIRSPAARQLAGGFTIELGLSRALNDAFSCLGWKSSLNAST